MRILHSTSIGILSIIILSCQPAPVKKEKKQVAVAAPVAVKENYDELKARILATKIRLLKEKKSDPDQSNVKLKDSITNFWIKMIGIDLYAFWKGTPWDFNGTSPTPGKGTIACGYFVTMLLRDIGLSINRKQLSVLPSSEMMRKLCPRQRITKLNEATTNWLEKLKDEGKGVYIIGLDYHTGFIVNDGLEIWFIHANYFGKQGVIKEKAAYSRALISSNTKWIISLTNDQHLIQRWLEHNPY